eukprot:scaffold60711_cov65-Attheya_sp.AAC.10
MPTTTNMGPGGEPPTCTTSYARLHEEVMIFESSLWPQAWHAHKIGSFQRTSTLLGEQLLYHLSGNLSDEQHQGILTWQWPAVGTFLAALHNWSAAKPDSSDNLENKVKDDDQTSEDVEGVKEENVVESLLEQAADLKEKREFLSV